MSILALNAGSSTLKFTLFARDTFEERAAGVVDWKGGAQASVTFHVAGAASQTRQAAGADFSTAVALVLEALRQVPALGKITACGHRVVHGGERFTRAVRIDAEVKRVLRELCELAPLHNPPSLAVIEAAEQALPDVPHVAVFDTAFFADLPPEGFVYPAPYAWYTDWGIRRFGFHGISHHYCTRRTAELLHRDDARLIVCHLGNGCSVSAVRAGRAIFSTMGYTPIDGLMMGTRPGAIDPGILLHVLKRNLLTVAELEKTLWHESGLLGVSGVSSDFRQVQAAADTGHERARLALALYAGRVRAAIGALAAMLGGLDALVFTAGVGEHSAWLRHEVCRGLEFLGVTLDESLNAACRADAEISTSTTPVRVLVLHTREELLIARAAAQDAECE